MLSKREVAWFEWDEFGRKRSTESPKKLARIRADKTTTLKPKN
jgi:hypothetical protein